MGSMTHQYTTGNLSESPETDELRLTMQPVMAGAAVAEVAQVLDASERAAGQVRELVARNDEPALAAVLNILEAVQLTDGLVEEGVDTLVGDLVAIMEGED